MAHSLPPDTYTIRSRDGLRLFVREWRPSVTPRAVVCVLHGHGEHGGRHHALAEALAGAGFAVLAPDLRGHGLSEGKRGHTPSYEHLLDDVDRMLEHAAERFPGLPRFLYGHSLGGNIALNYVLRRSDATLAGVVTTAPWLRLKHEMSLLRVALAHLVEPVWPSLTVSTSVDLPKLDLGPFGDGTQVDDPLNHDRISLRLFLEMRRAGKWALEHAGELTVPALLLHGELDDVADVEASKAFAAATNGLCQYRLLPDDYHNVHEGPKPEAYISAVKDWLLERIGVRRQ